VGERQVAAPALRETADVWFDLGRDPVVTWDRAGQRFELADPADPAARLLLFVAPAPVARPDRLAATLAEGLAACDFPPTGDGAATDHVRRALRAAGVDPDAP